MWIINEYPAYEMLSGWMTQAKLACLVYMEDTKASTLKLGGKNSRFDCHRRFLDLDHPCNRFGFIKNTIENDEASTRLNNH